MSKRNPELVRVVDLADIGKDAYSRPIGLVQIMCLEIISLYSSRGTVSIKDIERAAHHYIDTNPDSAEPINIFLKQVQKLMPSEEQEHDS